MRHSKFGCIPFFSSPKAQTIRRLCGIDSRAFLFLAAVCTLLAIAPSSFGDQFVLFDVTFPFSKEDADNSSPSKSHYYVKGDKLNPARPRDWTSPVDYRNGTVHIRTEVLEKPPGGEPVTWSICYIPNHGQGNGYGCTSTDLYREKGIYEKDVSMKSFWENDSIVWSEGIRQMDLVMKDDSGGSGHVHKRADSEKFFPTRMRFTVVQVSAGSKYDPVLVPNLPSQITGNSTKSTSAEGPGWTARQDHQNMMDQLGIKSLRPGPSGPANATNAANYDSSRANPYPDLPDPLILKNGQKVTSADMWWKQRRPEIAEDFGREVIGRIPPNVPKVNWTISTQVVDRIVGGIPVTGKLLAGRVDNSAFPAINVDIQMTLVTPTKAEGAVPVLMMFGGMFGGNGLPPSPSEPATNRFNPFGGTNGPSSFEQLIAAGWGYAVINPVTIQPDNGAGLTKGIIGLVNKGLPRKPDDWGSLRAWSWGAARGLDYLETDPAVNAKKVGIEGVSRYGKAALVTMAFEPRFAIVLVGSSGEGGAKLHRRNFGEAVENLTGSGEYHWMAGNFLKYGAADATFGSKTANDLPVDAHELIALCAPRPTFISYGIPEKGDANWLDQQGSYMATVAAGPVFRLLGAHDLGEKADYRTAKMPPVNTGLLDGQLAWRQHDGGHEDRSNMKYFITWANQQLHHVPSVAPLSDPAK